MRSSSVTLWFLLVIPDIFKPLSIYTTKRRGIDPLFQIVGQNIYHSYFGIHKFDFCTRMTHAAKHILMLRGLANKYVLRCMVFMEDISSHPLSISSFIQAVLENERPYTNPI
jgi:hypothetical protein